MTLRQNLAIAGGTGMLGSCFLAARQQGHLVHAIERSLVQSGNEHALAERLASFNCSHLINCIAHTDVEQAEVGHEHNQLANIEIPRRLAVACRSAGITLVQISSTGCYGEWKRTPYVESDICRPTTAHHRAKIRGEEEVRRIDPTAVILRVGWLYGGDRHLPKNFVWNRIEEGRAKFEIVSDATQIGCPTYVGDVRDQAIRIIQHGGCGVFNVVCQGTATRYEYVEAIIDAAGLRCRVLPGPAFVRSAPVSWNEAALNTRLEALSLNIMPEWRPTLQRYVRSLLLESQLHV